MSLGEVGTEGLPLFIGKLPSPRSWTATEDAPPPRARNSDPETSHRAAEGYFADAKNQNKYIHAALLTLGPAGGDCYAIAAQLGGELAGWDSVIVSRRLKNLRESGAVLRLERTVVEDHRPCHVHVAAEYHSHYREQDLKPEPEQRRPAA